MRIRSFRRRAYCSTYDNHGCLDPIAQYFAHTKGPDVMPKKNLPKAVWKTILRMAVHINGALETKMSTQFEWLDWRYNEEGKYAQSMVIKLTVVRVCREWHNLGVELLYEDIRLVSSEQTQSLFLTLSASISKKFGYEHANEWWTKRLDFSYQINDNAILQSLTSFPNLLILRFLDLVPDGTAFLPPNLRYAFMKPMEDHLPKDLDTLFIMLTVNNTKTFSNLTALEIFVNDGDAISLSNYSFPNVRHLTISNIDESDFPALRFFLQRHGSQLVSLRVSNWDADLLPLTPNIKELIIFQYTILPPLDNQTYPSVTHVGILFNEPFSIDELADPILDQSFFPNLKCVRLNGVVFSPVVDPEELAEYKDLYQKNSLAQVGVRFEDANGKTWLDMINPEAPIV